MATDLVPGPELDEKIARLVWPDMPHHRPYGISPIYDTGTIRYLYWPPVSNKREAALLALDALIAQGWSYAITYEQKWLRRGKRPGYDVILWRDDDDEPTVTRRASSIPLAICAAVLAALKGE
jgi:hypothetical protein